MPPSSDSPRQRPASEALLVLIQYFQVTTMRRERSDGKENHSGIQSEIRKTLFSYALAKARNWLLKQMLDRNLVTRDILSFAKNQQSN